MASNAMRIENGFDLGTEINLFFFPPKEENY
jgi:hypothetical protein